MDFAEEKERQLEEIRATGKMVAPDGTTVAHYIDDYLEYIQNGRTLQRSALFIYKSLKARFGKIRIEKLSKHHLSAFIEDRKREGVQGVTIAGDLSMLSSVLRHCSETRYLNIDPDLADMSRKSIKTEHKLRIKSREVECVPTQSELDAIISQYDGRKRQEIDMPTIIEFALATSMRQSEICRLEIEDLNHEAKTVLIRQRKHPTEKEYNDETVPLLPKAWAIVERVVAGRISGFIFPYNPKSVSTSYTRARQTAGIKRPTRFHDIRHKAISDFFAMGLNVPQVALMSGHKDWQTLKRYTHVKPSDVHVAHGALSDKMEDTKSINENMSVMAAQIAELLAISGK
ncbi:site-specific integrase [Pseudomonas sp. T8]|uniref:tyrosine-type recombinase/integrase n=1 Tax=Pseudomonas sp. T8 TaxID=645292 RepID=UPI00214787C2|nr:site-specific integrase [Pseudomonas sp. T8]UUT24119.1 site-specific integrase [Pseudomonas sp. T8]